MCWQHSCLRDSIQQHTSSSSSKDLLWYVWLKGTCVHQDVLASPLAAGQVCMQRTTHAGITARRVGHTATYPHMHFYSRLWHVGHAGMVQWVRGVLLDYLVGRSPGLFCAVHPPACKLIPADAASEMIATRL
jgi:hypothetical protein